MDVTCERCGTEYEFDETLVSDRGTTVKCTNCGHLFKVFRPDAGGLGGAPSGAKSSPPRGGVRDDWHIEQRDGQTRTLGSLKELQRLIADGALTPADRISRGGEGWKPLGEIAELATFFESASASATDVDRPPRRRTSTSPGPSAASTRSDRPLARTMDGAAAPPMSPERRPKSTIMGVGAISSEPPPPRSEPPVHRSEPPPSEPPRRAAPPRPASSRPPPPPRPPRPSPDVTAQARPAQRTIPSEPRRSEPHRSEPHRSEPSRTPAQRGLYLDAHEPVTPTRARSRSGLWVSLVVFLAAVVGVALAWPQIAPHLGLAQAADPARPHVDAGDDAITQDHIRGYEDAVHHYTQALAYDDHDPRALTGLSRAQALWAQALLFDAADLEARAADDPARAGEAAAIRRQARRHAETALRRAEDAVRHASNDVEAEVVLADALRLTSDLAGARSKLERALTFQSNAAAETLRVNALIEVAEAGGDLSAARPFLEEAVRKAPDLIRARLVYARALLAANDVAAAREQVDAALGRDAEHPRARALQTAIDQGLPPAPPTVDVPDGGVPDAGAATAEVREEEPEPAASEREARPTARAPAGHDYSWYIRSADEQRARGNTARARELYEAARAERPSGSEALAGLGALDLRSGNAQSAANLFRQAAGQGYAEAYMGLGDAYRRLGRTRDALTAYDRYLQRLPGGPHAAAARANADALRAQLEPAAPEEPEEPAPAAPEPEPAAPDAPEADPAPPTPAGALPAPEGMESPPPADVPAVESDPDFQP